MIGGVMTSNEDANGRVRRYYNGDRHDALSSNPNLGDLVEGREQMLVINHQRVICTKKLYLKKYAQFKSRNQLKISCTTFHNNKKTFYFVDYAINNK